MPEVVSIIATLAAIKNSIDIVKAVKDADYDLDKAILKERIVDLVDSLLEAKIQAGETLDLIQEKDKLIKELEESLRFKAKLKRKGQAYYETDENGNPIGDAYCSNCWESNHKAIHIHSPRPENSGYNICPNCRNEYNSYASFPIEQKSTV